MESVQLTWHAKLMSDFEFKPPHTHLLKGKPVVSVTEMIEASGFSEPGAEYYTNNSRDRGLAVHQAVKLMNEHCPKAVTEEEVADTLELGESIWGYVRGYLLFKRETGFIPVLSEKQVGSALYRVAGIMDIHGHTPLVEDVLVDLKTWNPAPVRPKRASEIQVAGYKVLAWESLGVKTDSKIILDLPGDGTYRQFCCDRPHGERIGQEEAIFCSIATVYADRLKHGLVKLKGEQ